MDYRYYFFRWLEELDFDKLLLYFVMPILVLTFLVDWFRDFFPRTLRGCHESRRK